MVFWAVLPGQSAGEEFQISFTCAECHEERYDEWTRSMHALAVSDPIFRAAYTRAVLDKPEYREYCLTCHSPTTIKTKDFNLMKSISIEGVTCIFCHTVTEVNNNSYSFNGSNDLAGPNMGSKTDAHGSVYSDLITRSEFCAGCHEFSLNGIPISETYSEWKEGWYSSKGVQCQDCHMNEVEGRTSHESGDEKAYQHYWYGGHSGQFLEKAVNIDSEIQQTENRIKVTIKLTNSKVGHKIPSGFPSRKLILKFKALNEDGDEIFTDSRVYTKILLDQYGNQVYDFWKATSIGDDNRIKPKETRVEVFEFDIQDNMNKLDIQASLNYMFEAQIMTLSKKTMDVEIANIKESQWLNETGNAQDPDIKTGEDPAGNKVPAPGWTGAIISMVLAFMFIRKKMPGGKF